MTIDITWKNEDAFFITPSVAVFADHETYYLVTSFTFLTILVSVNRCKR
jgi:hypothetical protein